MDILQHNTEGFPYGLNWSKPPEAISEQELCQAENCEYRPADGSLSTVPGIISLRELNNINVIGLYYDKRHDCFYVCDSGHCLYVSTDNFKTLKTLGTTDGLKSPQFAVFGDSLLIASGGFLQILNTGSDLVSVMTGPKIVDGVSVRSGRAVVFSTTDDILHYSKIGDPQDWKLVSGDKSAAVDVSIGYKDPGNIIAIDYLSKVLMVYKSGGRAYKVVGEPGDSDFSVQPVSQTAYVAAKDSVVDIDSKAYYLGSSGFESFVPTTAYGDVEPFAEGLNINNKIAPLVDANAKIFKVLPRNQIWLKTQDDKRIYIYHYIPRYQDGRGVFTTRTFSEDLNAVCCKGDTIYLGLGNKICKLDSTTDTDNGVQIETIIKGCNKIAQQHSILVMSRNLVCSAAIAGHGILQVGKRPKPFVFNSASPLIFNNKTKIYGNTAKIAADSYVHSYKVVGSSMKSVQVYLHVQKGAISLRILNYDFLEV